jgi:hypothetical protein
MDEQPKKRRGPLLWLAGRSLRFWISAFVVLVAIPVLTTALSWFWPWGLTTINAQRIVPGMTKAQVEEILGPPNPGNFELRRKKQGFWDAMPMLGFQYIAITVQFDADGNVESTIRLYDVWSYPQWIPRSMRWW